MNPSAPFIRRPVGTALFALAILLAGLAAFTQLPVAPLPRVDFPTISVSGGLPGASPDTMAASVAAPLERRFGRIAGVTEITSVSSLGASTVTLQFDLSRDVDAAARDVQAAINAAAGELPPNLPSRPNYRKVNPSDAPVLILALWSESVPLPQVYDQANTVLAARIAQVEGVGQVFVGGGQNPAVRIQADPLALAGRGLAMDDLRAAIAAATSNSARGTIAGATEVATLRANGQLAGAADFARQVVVARDGATLRLGEIARVYDDVENDRVAGWFDGRRAVLIIVRRQPGANVIATVDRVRALLPELMAAISPAIHVGVAIDRTQTIRASVHDVEFTLALSVALVVLVVFAFLRDVRAALIPTVVVPLSLVGTFGGMYLLGFSLNNLSLMALTISTGFVVDDAIVVTEHVTHLLEQGRRPMDAALAGARHIGFTIVSITVSLLAVFIPILLMGGVVGRLFREFAVTLAVAVAISAVLSLTLTPTMCSRLLRAQEPARRHGVLYRATEAVFVAMQRSYEWALVRTLDHRALMLAITAGAVALTGYLAVVTPKGLFPEQDTGMLIGISEAPQDISFEAMRVRQIALDRALREDPDIAHVVAFLGGGPGGSGNTGSVFVALKPGARANAAEVIARVRRRMARVAGISLFLQSVQDVRVGGRAGRAAYQYTLQDVDARELSEWAPRVLAALRQLPQLRDVSSDAQNAGLSLDLTIDRDAAARLGVTMRAVDTALYDAFGQRQVATIFSPLNQYRVVLEAPPEARATPEAIAGIYVRAGAVPGVSGSLAGRQPATPAGTALVPLGALLARVRPGTMPLAVNHQGQFPSVTLSFNLARGVSLGQAVDAIDRAEARIGVPPGVRATFAGTAQAYQESLASEPALLLAALLAVYIVLGVLYESLIHPLTILSTLPSAGVGAFAALWLTHTDFSIVALIGLVLLVGIVKKNAILIVDFALEAERTAGLSPREAIYRASALRFRPIIMTTLAALLGALPLAIGHGPGSELRRPLGIAIVGGLIASQLVTLFTTPVIYLVLDRFTAVRRRARDANAASPAVGGVPA